MKKKIIAFLFCCLFFVSATGTLAACGSKRDGLIVWWVSGQQNEKIINDAVETFKAENPGVKINIVSKAGMDVFNAYKIALGDNKSRPDIAILDHVYIQSLAHDGLIANLTDLGADDIKDKYPEGLYNAVSYNSKAYSLPLSANTIILMYNKDILKAAGVTEDGTTTGEIDVPQTLDELFAACEKVKKIGKTPFAQPINSFSAMNFMSYVGRLGGKIISDDYKTITINSDTKVKTALEKWKYFTENSYANKNEFEEGKFYTGQVAFVEMGSWNISKVTGTSSLFECGFSEMVTINADLPNYSGLGLYALAVAEKSEDKPAAYKLAKFLSTDKGVQLAFNKSQNLFPVTNEALQDSYYTDSPILATYASQMQKLTPRPGTPVWPDVEQSLVTMLRSAVIDGNLDASLANAQRDAQAATDRLFK